MTANPSLHPRELSADENRVVGLLRTQTYEQVSAMTGWSRGRIYQLALSTGTRKTEARIRERSEERKHRQMEFPQSMLDTTVKADVLDFLDGMPDDSVELYVTSPALQRRQALW